MTFNDEKYKKGMLKMQAMRQGLQYNQKRDHEMAAARSMVEIDPDWRWYLSPRATEFIADNCVGEVSIRYDVEAGVLIIGADDATDLTMLATAF